AVYAGGPAQIEYADPRVVRAVLAGFVTNFRAVTPDAVVQKQYIDRVYAMLRTTDPATEKVNGWFRSASPFEKAKTATVSVEVNNVVPLMQNTRPLSRSAVLIAATIVLTSVAGGVHAQNLTGKEIKGIDISGQWRGRTGLVTRGPDGKVIFLYGEVQPSSSARRFRSATSNSRPERS
ncbi:MAG: hypothetical protein ACK43M_24115, partial [Allorhizobium sp.]